MKIRYALVSGALALGLAACGNDGTPAGNANAERTEVEHYQPGETYDAEDYNGPAQQVTGHDHEEAEYGTRTKRVQDGTERYCSAKKSDGTCKTYSTRAKYKNVSERYEKDDADWYVVLADGTRVDVTAEQQAAHPVGSIWP